MPEKCCIGVLLDVSGSMSEQLNVGTDSRADASIDAIAEIIKVESSNSNDSEVFVAAFGLRGSDEPMDLL